MANLVDYVKTVWENGKTALNAARMNNMEQGISNCATQINKLGDSVSLINETAGIKDFNDILYNSILTLQCDKAANAPYQTGWVTIWTQRIANNLDYFSQMAISVNTAPKVFIRARFGGEWGEWRGL